MKQNTPTTPKVLSVAAFAREVNRSPRTILHWITAGKLAAEKTGPGTAGYVIDPSEVERIKSQDAA